MEGLYDQMCIEQKQRVHFATDMDASTSFVASLGLSEIVQEVRVQSSEMEKCSDGQNYRLNYDILINLKMNASDGLVGYIPYCVKHLYTDCHFHSSNTLVVEMKTEKLYLVHMSTDCRPVEECDAFQRCEDGSEGVISLVLILCSEKETQVLITMPLISQ